MDRRRFVQTSLAGALAVPLLVEAQQKVHRIGVVVEHAAVYPWLHAFREGLRERGYTEGANLLIEERNLQGVIDRAPAMIGELLRLKVDVLVVGGALSAQSARAQTSIPIVFTTVADPVQAGLVNSLARPGGNVTGLSNVSIELNSKQLELLAASVPHAARIAVLYNPTNPLSAGSLARLRETARVLRVELDLVELRRQGELSGILSALAARRVGAMLAVSDPLVGSEILSPSGLAVRTRLPAVYARKEFAEAGGLLAYGPSFSDAYRRAAVFVDKILKGANPADLPVEQPTTFELVINLKTAKALGLTIPPSLLARADHIIE